MSDATFLQNSCDPSDKHCVTKCIDPAAVNLRNNWNHNLVLYLDIYVSICIGTTTKGVPCKNLD